MLKYATIVLADIGYPSPGCRNGEITFGLCRQSPNMSACIFEWLRHISLHDITRAKVMTESFGLGFCTWETEAVHQAHLSASVACRANVQRHNSLYLDLF